MCSYDESKVYEAMVETAERMLEDGKLPIDRIAQYSGLSIEVVTHLAESLQTV